MPSIQIMQISLLMIITFLLLVCESRNVGKCIKDIHGSKCYQPKSNWQHDGICLRDKTTSRSSCHIPDTRQFKFSIAARLRQLKILPGVKKVTNLWIKGSGPGLSWEKPLALQKSASALDKWKVDISYTYDSNALLCLSTSHCSLQQKALEFRVYRDELGKQDMLGPNFYIPLPISNSMAGALGFTAPEVMVYPWFDGTSTTVQQIRIRIDRVMTRNLGTMTFNMILPPSFDFNARKTYPLVLLFGAPTITHTLEHMYVHEASIKEAIVVTIDYVDDAPFCLFNPFNEDMTPLAFESNKVWRCKGSSQECHDCQTCWDEQRLEKCEKEEFINQAMRCLQAVGCFGRADDLLDHIELKLLSEVAKKTQNRAQVNFPRDRMSIIGFDGAGLLACYAALTRPYYYQHAACLSTPFHWPMPSLKDIGVNRARQGIGQVLHELNTTLLISPGLRLLHMTQKFYVDIGENDNFFFPAVDPYENAQWFVQLLKDTLWLEDSTNVYFSVVPDGGNSYYHHKRGAMEVFNRLKVPLFFFLRAEGGPNRDFPRIAKVSDTAYHQQELDLGISSKEIEESSSEGNDTASQDTCHAFDRRRRKPQGQSGVPIPVFLVTVGKH
jgi:enterochelin esterase-like enzyme